MSNNELKLEWTVDVTLCFDHTVNMGHGFDWDTLETTQEQTTTCRGDFKVFASGCNREWSVYGGNLAYFIFQEFKTIDDAKAWVQNYHNECLIEAKDDQIKKIQSERDELIEALLESNEMIVKLTSNGVFKKRMGSTVQLMKNDTLLNRLSKS